MLNPLDGEPDEEEEESPEVNEAEVEVMDEDDDGEFWKLLIPIFEPMVFLTILSSMLPYFSLTIKLVLVESIMKWLFWWRINCKEELNYLSNNWNQTLIYIKSQQFRHPCSGFIIKDEWRILYEESVLHDNEWIIIFLVHAFADLN